MELRLAEAIKQKARELGFDQIGIRRAFDLGLGSGLRDWLAAKHHGQMHWMAKDPSERDNPIQVLPGAKSLVCLTLNYYSPEENSLAADRSRISRYAWGDDYHRIFKEKLKKLHEWVRTQIPGCQGLVYSDTGPVMEKVWANLGGIGWVGKNGCLITREYGSWVFLGEILLDVELEYDDPAENYCGSCRRCLAACPTGAIVAPYVVDSRRCISYLTIELREPIPRELRQLMENRIFGCDDCQEICPWNRFAKVTREEGFRPHPSNLNAPLSELLKISREQFEVHFARSPVRRARHEGFLRNVAAAIGNSHLPSMVQSLLEALETASPLVRGHLAWALGEIRSEAAMAGLRQKWLVEEDLFVREEIQLALQPH